MIGAIVDGACRPVNTQSVDGADNAPAHRTIPAISGTAPTLRRTPMSAIPHA